MKAEYSTVTKNIVSVSFALLTIFATACGQRPWSAESVESELNIVGGQAVGSDVDDARRLSTVALTTDHRSARRTDNPHLLSQGRSFCSATIIAPRVLMTAAHCLQDFNPQTNTKSSSFILPSTSAFIAYFGTRVAMQGEWLRAVNVIAHPEWNPALTLQAGGGLPAHDIGLVILEKDVPAPYTPVAIADESLSVQVSLPVTIVGYGVTRSRRNNNTGTLRQVTVPLKKIDTHAQLLGVGAFMRGACAGDSGGPMYIRGEDKKWSVIGVTSAGTEIFQNCIGLDNTFTDARAYKKWIESSLAENGLAIKNQ
ncbi:MAG: hypothetical protein RLZZ488_989 [Pseudomonadota bacterium]